MSKEGKMEKSFLNFKVCQIGTQPIQQAHCTFLAWPTLTHISTLINGLRVLDLTLACTPAWSPVT